MKRKIGSEPNPGTCFHSQAENMIDLFVQYVRRQAVIRNTHPEHPAKLVQGFKDGDLKAFQAHVVCHGETGRS